MNKPGFKKLNLRTAKLFRRVVALLGLVGLLVGPDSGFGGEPPLTKHQVEAAFLLNFAKYVDWPSSAFPNATTPITIGVLGTDPFGGDLQRRVEGKIINGHPFVVKNLASDSEMNGCQILFICDSEASRMDEILRQAGALPILTVGEDEPFARSGGIINFVLKDGKVRLEIDLTTANKNGLKISSKLLAVADAVKGKTN